MKRRNKNSPVKRGPLSTGEKKKIVSWLNYKTDEEIAAILNRPLKSVSNYREEYLAAAPEAGVRRTEAEAYLDELHSDVSWELYERELTSTERIFFEKDYVKLRSQLGKETTSTELKQLYQLIMIDVLMHRLNADRMKNQQDIERLERLLKDEYAKGGETNIELAAQLETNLQACRSTSTARTKEYKDLLDKSGTILRDLKTTRDQRIKHLEDRGKFIVLLKELEQEDRRSSIGEIVGLTDLGIDAERERLTGYHEYVDGVVDQPLLTPETVLQ